MKVRGYIIALAVAGLGLISCSKETGLSADGTRVAYIGLAADAGSSDTKSSINDLNVSWTAGDDILYYTGRYTSGSSTAKTGEGSYKVPAACSDLKLPVEYNDGDNRVTILTKGHAVGNVTPASLNSLTIAGAVPASQDGTFASSYIAACEGNLLELTELTTTVLHNLAMTPVQAFVRFKLSSLTVSGQTVNKITVEGKVGGSAVPVCGDLSVSITENGSTTHTVSSASSGTPGNLITIDKTGSKFNAGEYIYVALLPRQYDELTLTLYNGGTTLATVPVKQGSGSQIDLGQGKMVDLGEINPHAVIKFISAKMYPEKVAISSAAERPTKYLWLKIEPEDFSGTVTWTSSNTSYATVESVGTPVDEPGIGRCIKVKVTNKVNKPSDDYNLKSTDNQPVEYKVNITATITDPSDGRTYTDTCKITIGNFLDLGIRNSEGKRILFARQVLRSYISPTAIGYQLYYASEKWMYNGTDVIKSGGDNQSRVLFGWGEIHSQSNFHDEPLHFAWGFESANAASGGVYSKYNLSRHLPHLQRYSGEFESEGIPLGDKYDTVDDVASRWNPAYNIPTVSDMAAFINGTKKDPKIYTGDNNTSYYIARGTAPGYTDTYLYILNKSQAAGSGPPWLENYGWWTCEDEIEYVGNAFYFEAISYTITSLNKYRRSYMRPVKYED